MGGKMPTNSKAAKRASRQDKFKFPFEFVSKIRFDGKRVVIRGKKVALLAAAAQNETGTAGAPTSVPNWLPDLIKDENWTVSISIDGREPGKMYLACCQKWRLACHSSSQASLLAPIAV